MDNFLKDHEKQIKRVLWIELGINIFLALSKLIVGQQFHFLSLTSSGLDSLFDGSSNILGFIAISLAYRPPSSSHPYGRHKYETLGSLLIAGLLIFTSLQIGMQLFAYFGEVPKRGEFGLIPVITILISILASYLISEWERRKGEELSSSLLIADSAHTRGDFYIGIGALVSIIAAKFGLWWPDFVVGTIICLFLFYLALRIVRENLGYLMDASPKIEKDLIKQVEKIAEVVDIHRFRARGNQKAMFVDFHLLLTPTLSLREAHEIGHKAEEKIKDLLKEHSEKVDVTVHIEPFEKNHYDPE
ncbi:MAG: hypothetical protein DRQ88_03530 [Epsilonproteobacteria bacterium]|nr:MAG: hypothetical protein DRQ89_03960 [Campylobacterota bacterium]RLA67245.1 MAG: hypothetical protein DRQ88_03530 [Campylobacterota bacterium]